MSSITNPLQGPGFLSFNSHPPRIWITSSSSHASEKLLLAWKEEGFEANYLPYTPHDQAGYTKALKNLHNNLEFGEMYALVCYGEAASLVLKTATKPMPKLCAIIAFYPAMLPTPKQKYPSLLQVQVHVAGLNQISPRPEMCEWKLYRYEKSKIGFADLSAEEYSEVDANLAWSRGLGTVRKAFKKDVDLEPVVQAAWNAKYEDDVPERGSMAVVQNMTQNSPHLTILPTLQGAIGRKKLVEFYQEFFIPSLVEDFDIRLISRTIGVDRVVDEMVVSFTHSDEVDWILPGVAPTNKRVEIAIVSIVSVRGGKLASEHMYWDQASVLVQVGLLDPKVVPKKFKNDGLKQLPIIGAEAARQLLEPKQERYNDLLKKHGLMNGMNSTNGVSSC